MEEATVIFGRPDAPRQIILEDAIAAGVLPTWTEAVALTRAIAWQLYRAGGSAPIPNLSEIALFSTGVVHLEGGQPHDGGQIAGVGEIMGDLLEHVSAPPQVSDVQQQAMVQPPVFATLLEFHNALDFFARPDAKAVLADYHSRATAALAQTTQNDFLSELKEKTKAHQPDQGKKKKAKKLPRWVPVAAAALLLGAGGAAAFFMFGRSSSPAVQQSTNAALSLLTETGKKMQDATTNVVSKLIGGATEAAPAEAPAANVSPSTVAPPVPRRRLTPQQKPMAVSELPPAVAGSPSEPATPSPPPAAEPADPPPAVVDVGVYTPADATVEAPVLVYPQLPSKPTRDTSLTKPGELDLLVLEDGTVAEARLIPQSDRLQDRMLISAAKAWRFRPATKDGRPVRYRTRIPITW